MHRIPGKCVASVPVRAERNNRAARRSFAFRTRGKWGENKKEARKMGQEKRAREGGGGGERREFPSSPPHPLSCPFCSHPISLAFFALAPFSALPECETPSHDPITSLGLYRKA